MEQILIALTFFVLFVGCKKKDCIDWTYPESESIIISKTDYNKASDVSKSLILITLQMAVTIQI